MLEQLRERHPIELPEGVVEEETRSLLREYAESLARQGVDVEKVRIDWDALAERGQARRPSAACTPGCCSTRWRRRTQIDVAAEELEERLAPDRAAPAAHHRRRCARR